MKFKLKTKIYPLECILNTAYLFLDQIYFFVDGDPKSELEITIKGKDGVTNKELDSIYGEFNNELINQKLRMNLAKQNKKIQEYIVGKALFGITPQLKNIEEVTSVVDSKVHNVSKEEELLDKMLADEIEALETAEKACGESDDPLGILNSWEADDSNEK